MRKNTKTDKTTRSGIYVVLVNVAVFLGLFLVVYFSIPVVNLLGKSVQAGWPPVDPRSSLPNYAGQDWARIHFAEMRALQTDFMSYLGWRRQPFRGQTITVEEGMHIRHTPTVRQDMQAHTVYFFGGSTMWGVGTDDGRTIPALYQSRAGGPVLNFGEAGWVAHQSLNQLIKLYSEGHRPNVVVFYDGVNEVAMKCRKGNDFWADDRQEQIRQALAYKPVELGYYAQPIVSLAGLAGGLAGSEPRRKYYDCDENPAKATLIATQLVTDWKIAAMLVRSYGGRFLSYLQPVAFLSHTKDQHLRLNNQLGAQYRLMYPIIRQKMAEQGIGIDISTVLDRDAFIYIDFCHISPNGNALVAERIAQDVADTARP